MSNAPQNQNQPTQKVPSSNQGMGKTEDAGKVGNNTQKDEPTAKGGMKNEGGMKGEGSCSSSDNKPKQGGCN